MTTMPIVLVVDDEKSLRDFVRRNLEVRGFHVVTAPNGLEAMSIFDSQKVDLVIMDLMMPHLDGLATIRQMRKTSTVPILILTALGEETEKVKAFDLGADDYLTKPFGLGELLGRVKAVLRRARWAETIPEQEAITIGAVTADLIKHRVTIQNRPIELTPTEFKLLTYLMKNAGKLLPHRLILQNVWGPEYGEEAEYLRVYMGKLRQKIEPDPLNPRYILTERGVGYRFEK